MRCCLTRCKGTQWLQFPHCSCVDRAVLRQWSVLICKDRAGIIGLLWGRCDALGGMGGRMGKRESIRPGEGSGCQKTNTIFYIVGNVRRLKADEVGLTSSSSSPCLVFLFSLPSSPSPSSTTLILLSILRTNMPGINTLVWSPTAVEYFNIALLIWQPLWPAWMSEGEAEIRTVSCGMDTIHSHI